MKAAISFVISAICAAGAADAEAAPIFSCTAGGAALLIEDTADGLRLTLGDPAAGGGEIIATGASSVGHGYVIYNRAEDRWLRFFDGPESLLVYERWSAPSNLETPEKIVSGVLVLRDGEVVAGIGCSQFGAAGSENAKAGVFSQDFDYDALPSDDPALAELLPDYDETPEE